MRVAPDDDTGKRPSRLTAPGALPERRCVLTGAHGPRDLLVRLVLGPDGEVWPDVAARLPGRGAWIAVDRHALARAVADGSLRRALARALRAPPQVPADLADRILGQLERRLVDRLGLEHRGGRLAFGAERLERLARSGRLSLLAHAADAAAEGRAALDQAFRAGGGDPALALPLPLGRESLSKALGRANVVHLGATDGGAASRIATALSRWRRFAGDAGTNASDRPGAASGVRAAAGDATGPGETNDGHGLSGRQERIDAR